VTIKRVIVARPTVTPGARVLLRPRVALADAGDDRSSPAAVGRSPLVDRVVMRDGCSCGQSRDVPRHRWRREVAMSSAVHLSARDVPSVPATPEVFTEAEFAGLPEPVCRYLAAAIAPGVTLDRAVHVDARGRVRLRWWVPFRARYQVTPSLDFLGVGHAGELVVGVDHCIDGVAAQRLRLAGVIPLRDHPRDGEARVAAACRAALGAVVLPTALLPRRGVRWRADDDVRIRASLAVHGVPVTLRLRIDADGRPLAATIDHGQASHGRCRYACRPFRAIFTAEALFDGLTVPVHGRIGWLGGDPSLRSWDVLRFHVTAVRARAFAGRA
jgi:hypothetical protein